MRYFLRKNRYVVPILMIVLALLSGCSQSSKAAGTSAPTEASIMMTEPTRQPKDGIQTLLVLCLDQFDAPRDSGSYRNKNKADLIMLLIIDEDLGKTTALQLNPDTMVPFSAQGMSDTVDTPLGLVFSYGSGGSDSCLNERKAVSNLLGGIPIDHYMTFTVDSIAIVNDMIGGVTVAAAEEWPDKSTESGNGASLTLWGEDSIEFFSYRDDEDVANEAHMDRQRQYMTGLYSPFLANAQQESFLTKLTLQLGDGFSTDLTLSQMMQMLQSLGMYELEETIVTLQGTASKVDGEFQFYVDADSLDQTVESLFFR